MENHQPNEEKKINTKKTTTEKENSRPPSLTIEKRKTQSESDLLSLLKSPLSPKRQRAKISCHHPLSPKKKRSRRHHLDTTIIKQSNTLIREFIDKTETMAKQLGTTLTDIDDRLAEIEKLAMNAIRALKKVSRFYLHEYNTGITTHNAITSLAAAMTNYANPTLIAQGCYEDALEATAICNQMHQSLNLLSHNLEQQCTLKTSTPNTRKEIIQQINKCVTYHKQSHAIFKQFKHKVKTTTLMKKKNHYLRYLMQKRLIENNPETEKTDQYQELDSQALKIENEIQPFLTEEEKAEITLIRRQVSREEVPHIAISKLEKLHKAALNPYQLLEQYNNDGLDELKLNMILEIAEGNSGHPILYRSISQLKFMLIEMASKEKEEEINKNINVAKLIHHVIDNQQQLPKIFNDQFSFIKKLLKDHLPRNNATEFNEKTQQIERLYKEEATAACVLIGLPEAIILSIKTVNKIEKDRLKKALDRIPETIRVDMLNLESKQYKTLLSNNRMTLDQTKYWVTKLFKKSESLNIMDAEKFSKNNYRHFLEAGLLELLLCESLKREALPDTLIVDYKNLTNIREFRKIFIYKYIIYYTLTSFINNQVLLSDDNKQNIQRSINIAFAQLPYSSTEFINTLLYLIEFGLEESSIKQVLKNNKEIIAKMIMSNTNENHRLFQIFDQRSRQIIRHAIISGNVDFSALKCSNIEQLSSEFKSTIDPTLRIIINNHMYIHKKFYQTCLKDNAINAVLTKVKKMIHQPNIIMSPYFEKTENYFRTHSLRFNKITLCAALMSLTQQFTNQIAKPINNVVTDDDITTYIKETHADVLFKNRQYSKDEIIQQIIEYRSLPLLNRVNLNLHIIFHHLNKTSFLAAISDSTTKLNKTKELFLHEIPNLLSNNKIEHSQKDINDLSSLINEIQSQNHPAIRLYQNALADIVRGFILTQKIKLAHKRKWAALHFFQPIIRQLCYDISQLIQLVTKTATQFDTGNQTAYLPRTQLRTGRSRL